MNNKKFSFRKRLLSFRYAFNGICLLFRNEHNAWIHLVITLAVIGFGIWLPLSVTEWILVIFAVGFVFSAEMFNSALEKLADAVDRQPNEKIKAAKDMAAGAVLVKAIAAAILGLIVFIPHLIEKWNSIF
ncbi:MAG: diacylglycerol kinase family protein [Prolixibacteraceae bacterium]|nr:diacylglycerol kinase family protein [Prolixibacteraceae bacterium]